MFEKPVVKVNPETEPEPENPETPETSDVGSCTAAFLTAFAALGVLALFSKRKKSRR